MIEGALVYILAAAPPNAFVGCGAVIEGGLIATCRHVWRDALAKAPDGAAPMVEYPGAPAETRRHDLALADSCEGEDHEPDLVLLQPSAIPSGTPVLQLAMKEAFETGKAVARARIWRDGFNWTQATVQGSLDSAIDPDHRRRQFTGEARQGYWFVRGSSGSPLFCAGGQQLAGILSLSELGANEHKTPLQEAFVVPATTIRRFVERLAARPAATAEHIDPAALRPVLDAIGAGDIPVREIPARLTAFVESAREQAARPVPATDDGADIAATLAAARDRLGRLDPQGARDLLTARVAEENAARAQRLLPLLREQAAIARMTYDGAGLRAALAEIAALAPDDAWAWIDLGDAWRTAGDLTQAMRAFRAAEQAAARNGAGRDLSVSHNKVGDVLWAQGDGTGALAAYTASLAIAERLAAADPANALQQRDLSVGHERIGNVLVAQGDGTGALAAYRTSLAIAERLAAADPADAEWQRDLSVSHIKVGDVLRVQGDGTGALAAYRASLAIAERLAAADSADAEWQRDLSVSHERIGDVLRAQGNDTGALAAYRASLAIAERLTAADPANALWQRDLSVSHERIGDVLVAQGDRTGALAAYRASLAIRERLAAADPANALWQRDLSVAHNKVGDALMAQSDGAGGLAAYRASLAIAERLAAADPAHAEWQRDLSVGHLKVGDVLVAQSDSTGASNSRLSKVIRGLLGSS